MYAEKKKDIQRMRGENKCLRTRRFFTFIACRELALHVLDIHLNLFIRANCSFTQYLNGTCAGIRTITGKNDLQCVNFFTLKFKLYMYLHWNKYQAIFLPQVSLYPQESLYDVTSWNKYQAIFLPHEFRFQ